MEPEALRVIERYGYNETVINPVALVFVCAMAVLVFVLPRRHLMLPLLATALFMTMHQRIVLLGFDFDMVRIMTFVYCIKFFASGYFKNIKLHSFDIVIFAFIFVNVVAYSLLCAETSALVNRLGWAYDFVGIYCICRAYFISMYEVDCFVRGLIFLSLPVACAMICEQVSGRNFFSVLGGVPELTFVRDGRLRSQGAFSHPILAGSFGAALMPIVVARWRALPRRTLECGLGMLAASAIAVTSSSSGPIIAYGAGIMVLCGWPLRHHLRMMLGVGFVMSILLQVVMNAPIYALVNRLTVFAGSTSGHRYRLIDATVKNFGEWWLLGTRFTGHWGWGLQDVTNMYVRVAIDSGFLGLSLFFVIIFYSIFIFIRVFESRHLAVGLKKYYWGLFAAFLVHLVSFWGVRYLGQMAYFWYLLLGINGAVLCQLRRAPQRSARATANAA